MKVALVPGLWLDALSWDDVVPALQAAGHETYPVTLPGLESVDADRSGIGQETHIDAVVALVDSLDEAVVLVGQTAAAGRSSSCPPATGPSSPSPTSWPRPSSTHGDKETDTSPTLTARGQRPEPTCRSPARA